MVGAAADELSVESGQRVHVGQWGLGAGEMSSPVKPMTVPFVR